MDFHARKAGSQDRGMAAAWRSTLQRWLAAGLIDAPTAEAITRWEASRPRARLSLPVALCLSLGGLLLASGLLLFVAAHWVQLGPGWRYGLVLTMLVALHGLAAAVAPGFPALAESLHGAGTVSLGGGIFLVGQIFHLETHWPAGLLLWAVGAGLGWLLLRQWPQLTLFALLTPAWLVSEWLLLCQRQLGLDTLWPWQAGAIPAAGLLLLLLTYMGAVRGGAVVAGRLPLLWLGCLGLFPAVASWFLIVGDGAPALGSGSMPLGLPLAFAGWTVALGGPLLLGGNLRGRRSWHLALAIPWILAGILCSNPVTGWTYGWRTLGGVLLVLWGVEENRPERINLGTALVALCVISFYFAEVMDKLERSFSLILLGVLCLLGGWALERLRRRMLNRLEQQTPGR
jgi:hypothetical protein